MKTTTALSAVFISLMSACSQKAPYNEVDLLPKNVFQLDNLKPSVNIGYSSFSTNVFAKDRFGTLYFLDPKNHKLTKYFNGIYRGHIGGIGQGLTDLFSPLGMTVSENSVFIINNACQEIKIFSLEGEYRSTIRIQNPLRADSICVGGGLIFLGVRYRDPQGYNSQGLITVFDQEGNRKPDIGKVERTASFGGYLYFNEISIGYAKGNIYGAFRNRPIIFCYGIKDGQQIYRIDLRQLRLEDIEAISRREMSGDYDTPETQKDGLDFKYLVLFHFVWGRVI